MAGIGVYTIHTPSTILTHIASTVVNIFLAVPTLESIGTGAVVLVSACLGADPTMLTGGGAAGDIHTVTVLPSPAFLAVALVSSVEVLTAPMLARVTQLETLVHIDVTVRPLEPFLTRALVGVAHRGALSPIPAGMVSTVVFLCAVVA